MVHGYELLFDPNPFYGRVLYTHAGGTDRAQSVIRIGLREPPGYGALGGVLAFGGPISALLISYTIVSC